MKQHALKWKSAAFVITATLFAAATATTTLFSQEEKGGDDLTGPYELVAGWPENVCGAGYMGGSTAGIFAENPDKVFIFYRGCLPVLEEEWGPTTLTPSRNASGYSLTAKDPANHPRWDHTIVTINRDGKMIDNWSQHDKLWMRPHKVLISPYDPQRHVWIVDDGSHTIRKFTNDGKQNVLTLGEFNVAGNDETHFARPTDIAWLPDGTFFVSDGYTNTRVVKFDPDGKFLMTWGQEGNPPNETRPGYMNTVHSVAVDAKRRVFVADRANSRVQIFDENGKFIEAWPNIRRPYYIFMAADQHLWVADGTTQKFTRFSPTGQLLFSWGTYGAMPGGFWGVHQFSTDSEGNLYTADVHIGRAQKFSPREGVDKSKLIPRQFGFGGTSTN